MVEEDYFAYRIRSIEYLGEKLLELEPKQGAPSP